jgi:3-hydroxyacyl-CoA dehydrogenase / 3-hydroxy-2-methylbutyryl-CoA dehydrogenase
MKIENRTFIVSGGSVVYISSSGTELTVHFISSSGLGLATVEDLISSSAYVAIFDRDSPPPELGVSRHVKYLKVDFTKLEEIEKAINDTLTWKNETGAELGGVINCAGVATASKVRILFF